MSWLSLLRRAWHMFYVRFLWRQPPDCPGCGFPMYRERSWGGTPSMRRWECATEDCIGNVLPCVVNGPAQLRVEQPAVLYNPAGNRESSYAMLAQSQAEMNALCNVANDPAYQQQMQQAMMNTYAGQIAQQFGNPCETTMGHFWNCVPLLPPS